MLGKIEIKTIVPCALAREIDYKNPNKCSSL